MSDEWFQVDVACRPVDTADVAAMLVAGTGHGVEEVEPGRLRAVTETRLGADQLSERVAKKFVGVTLAIHPLEPIDWTVHWRDGIEARRFGRLLLTPSWIPASPADGEVVMVLDPESAFGSGEHGSTRAALTLLSQHVRGGEYILDFGSGSGVLAIAGVLLGAAAAVGIEVDAESNPVAEENARRNGVADQVTFLLGDAEQLGPFAGPGHLLCSNILRTVNTALLPTIRESLLADGIAIYSGMEYRERELFLPVLHEAGWQIVDECVDADWWAVAARRPA